MRKIYALILSLTIVAATLLLIALAPIVALATVAAILLWSAAGPTLAVAGLLVFAVGMFIPKIAVALFFATLGFLAVVAYARLK